MVARTLRTSPPPSMRTMSAWTGPSHQQPFALRGIQLLQAARSVEPIAEEQRVDRPWQTQDSATDNLRHLADRRIQALGVAHDQSHAIARDSGNHPVGLREAQRQRFVEDDLLAVLGGDDGMLRVQTIRGQDVDRVQVGVGAHGLDRFVRGYLKFRRERLPRDWFVRNRLCCCSMNLPRACHPRKVLPSLR